MGKQIKAAHDAGGAQHDRKKPLCCLQWLARNHKMGNWIFIWLLTLQHTPRALSAASSDLPISSAGEELSHPRFPSLLQFALQAPEALQHIPEKDSGEKKPSRGRFKETTCPAFGEPFQSACLWSYYQSKTQFCCYHCSLGSLKRNTISQKC